MKDTFEAFWSKSLLVEDDGTKLWGNDVGLHRQDGPAEIQVPPLQKKLWYIGDKPQYKHKRA